MIDVNWTRSSSCVGGDCVEVQFVRSSACGAGSCVEVARVDDRVLVRDSKLGADSPVISLSSEQWVMALTRVESDSRPLGTFRTYQEGTFDPVGMDWAWEGVTLSFTDEEWGAFVDGVKKGEFDLPKLSAASLPDATAADEAAGRSGHRAAAEGAGEGALPAPSPASHVAAALVDLCRPEWLPREQPVGDEVDAWAREWATDAFAAGLTAAEGLARKQAGQVDTATEWARAIAPLVPTDSPVAMPGETVAVSSSAAATGGLTARTEGNGEVAPVELGGLAGATEPAGLCTCEREQYPCGCAS